MSVNAPTPALRAISRVSDGDGHRAGRRITGMSEPSAMATPMHRLDEPAR